MHIDSISRKYEEAVQRVSEKRIRNAFEVLSGLIRHTGMADYQNQLEHLETTYQNMLKYTLEGIEDPERQQVYHRLLESILELAQDVKEFLMAKFSGWHTYWLKKELEKEQKLTGAGIAEKLEDLTFKKELDELLRESAAISEEAYRLRSRRYKELRVKIFRHLWLSDRYREAELELLRIVKERQRFEWYDLCIFVSAITLSLMRYFDETKIRALFDFADEAGTQVGERALTGLVFALYHYDKRLFLYPEIKSRLQTLAEKPGIENEIGMIILQIIRSRETEKITRRMQEEIIPEMVRLRPNLQEKLDLDNLLKDDLSDEKNPGWKNILKDSEGLFSKMEEFSRLQMEGADVFMSAFAMLKHFDFFREISNWFLPFYPENDMIDEALSHEDPEFNKTLFIEGLYKTGYLCNSDKYSFCLNAQQMPAQQKTMILKLFGMEMDGMKELSETEGLTDPLKGKREIFTQYIQDLYRFFKLYPDKREFPDIFTGKLAIYASAFFRELVHDRNVVRNIAEYFFDKDNFEEAIELFLQIREEEPGPEITEKIAYCYQQMEQFKEALDFYTQAEMFGSNRLWNLKKIAYCHRKLKKPSEALKCYLEAEKLEPDNLATQASIGRCYLDLKEYEKALKYYFKVEFLDQKNKKVLRPIAWCYLVTGKPGLSKKYFLKIPPEEYSMYDMVNLGHAEWCLENKTEALDRYRTALTEKGLVMEKFLDMFTEDTEMLVRNGVNPDDIPILLDYLQYTVNL